MTSYGKSVLAALERGPMTVREVAFDTDISERQVHGYLRYHMLTKPPSACIIGTEVSEKTGRRVAIYATRASQLKAKNG